MLRRALNRTPEYVWILLLALLPLTSLPLMSKLVGSAMVMPPSGVALLALVLIWLLPALFRRMALPPQVKPLLLFAGAAALSSLAAYFVNFPLFRDINFTRHMLEAALTLAVGVCMYLVVASFPRDQRALKLALACINWSGLVIVAWSLAQGYFALTKTAYPGWMYSIQGLVSINSLFIGRVTGLAFEPSWLAHQLNMLYLPFWLAASARRTSAHRWRVLGISFENLLLVGGVAVLWLSLSRVGLVSLLLMLGLLLLKASLWLVSWIKGRIQRRSQSPAVVRRLASPLVTLALLAALGIFYLGLFLGAGFTLTRLDPGRMGKLFNFTALQQGNFMEYANQIVIAERLVYWQTGWEVFNDYPVLGVGLGNAGYFFPEKMSPFGWSLFEVNHLINYESSLPNTKSMWTRLLAETGLVGFSVFLGWMLLVWASGGNSQRKQSAILKTFGLAGQLAVLAFIVEGFSIDSFALPYLWVSFGLATAAWRVGCALPGEEGNVTAAPAELR